MATLRILEADVRKHFGASTHAITAVQVASGLAVYDATSVATMAGAVAGFEAVRGSADGTQVPFGTFLIRVSAALRNATTFGSATVRLQPNAEWSMTLVDRDDGLVSNQAGLADPAEAIAAALTAFAAASGAATVCHLAYLYSRP